MASGRRGRGRHGLARTGGLARIGGLAGVAAATLALGSCGGNAATSRTSPGPARPAASSSAPSGATASTAPSGATASTAPSGATAGTGSSTATWTARAVPAGVGYLNDVTCPSTARCYAVGGSDRGSGPAWVIGSADGGDGWQLLHTAPSGWLTAIACPGAQSCTAVGGSTGSGGFAPEALVTTDGGRSWTSEAVPPQVGALTDVACVSTSRCIAVGGGSAIAVTTDGGSTWTTRSLPTGLVFVDSVACPTSTFCMVGGSGPGPEASSPSMASVSDDGGASWSAATVVGGASTLGRVSCADARDCVGLIASGATDTYGTGTPIVTSDGGSTWQHEPTTVGGSVSCVQRSCVSVGASYQPATNSFAGAAFLSTDGGRDWTAMRVPTSDGLNAVTCRSAADCVAVGGNFPDSTSGVILTYGS